LKHGALVVFMGYFLLLFETAWGPVLQLGPVRPDGLVALVVWHGIRCSLPEGLLAVLALGVVVEPFTSLPVGLYPFAYAGGYLLVRYVSDHVILTERWQMMLLVFFVSTEVLVIILTGGGNADLFWPWGLGQAFLNGLLTPMFFLLFDTVSAHAFSTGAPQGAREGE